MNKKILLSLSVIGVVAAIVVGGTIAYFSDTETSTGNTFTAGAIDLTVDNTCYYNGIECIESDTPGVYYWEGTNEVCVCTWDKKDLEAGNLFFNFADIKPGDHGEDTISLYVTSNDAWSCAEIVLTANDDNTCVDPEMEIDTLCAESNEDLFDGELAQNLEFIWWADDGDNVLEVDELVVVGDTPGYAFDAVGGIKLDVILSGNPTDKLWTRYLTTADSSAWGGMFNDSPLKANTDYFIGKAWCFGDLTITPVPDDANTGPDVRNSGIDCDGEDVTNASQTDQIKGSLSFSAIQSRNNTTFKCPENR